MRRVWPAFFLLSSCLFANDIDDRLDDLIEMAETNARFDALEEQLSQVITQSSYGSSSSSDLDALREEVKTLKCQMDQITAVNAVCDNGVSLAHLRPEKGSGFYVTLAYLYWQPFVSGGEYAYSYTLDFNDQFPLTPLLPNGDSKMVTFGAKSGIRPGIGYTLPYDGWDLYLYYTYIRPKETESTQVQTSSLFPMMVYQGVAESDSVERARMRYVLRLQTLDFELGKGVFISPRVALRPHVGIRGAWIDQHYDLRYEGDELSNQGQFYDVDGENDFHAGGLRAGFDSTWFFGYGLHLFGDLAASLLWGNFDVRQKHQFDNITIADLKYDYSRMAPTVDMKLGLGWQIWFNCNRNCFRLRLGYEMNYFWDQFQEHQYTADTRPIIYRGGRDIGFHGLTIEGRMDF